MLGGPVNMWGCFQKLERRTYPLLLSKKVRKPQTHSLKGKVLLTLVLMGALAQWSFLGCRLSVSEVPGLQSSSCQECFLEGGLSRIWDSRIPHSFLGMEMATPARFPDSIRNFL